MDNRTYGYGERVVDYVETLSAPDLLAWRLIPTANSTEHNKRLYLAHHIAHEQWKAARALGDIQEEENYSETLRAIERTVPVSFIMGAIHKSKYVQGIEISL